MSQPLVPEHLGAYLGLVELQLDDALLDTRKLVRNVLVHELAHNHLVILTGTVAARNRLELGRRIPRRREDVDTRCRLEIQTNATRLDLNQKHGVGCRGPEIFDALFALVVFDATVEPKHRDTLGGQDTLEVISLAGKLGKHQRLFIRVSLQEFQERLVLLGPPGVQRRVEVILDGHPVEVQLRPDHHLADPEETLEHNHRIGHTTLDDRLAMCECLHIQIGLFGVHVQLDILKVEIVDIVARPTQDVVVPDRYEVPDDRTLGDADKLAERHKVAHRVEDWRTGDDPPDVRRQILEHPEHLRLGIPNLVPFVEDDSVPVKVSRNVLDERVGHEDDVGGFPRAFRTVKDVDREFGCEPGEFGTPLADDRLWDDDERRTQTILPEEFGELDRLSETHFVTQETTASGPGAFARQEPLNASNLVLEERHD